MNGQSVGYCGEVHPQILADVTADRVAMFELDLDALLSQSRPFKTGAMYKNFARFPLVKRDLAVVCDEQQAVGDLIDCVQKIDRRLTQKVEVVDLYQGDQIPQGKKSVALRVFYQADDRTLEDKDVDPIFEKAIAKLKDHFKAELRA